MRVAGAGAAAAAARAGSASFEAHWPAHCVLSDLCERRGVNGNALPAAEDGEPFAGEEKLLAALASHAALSMEKVRRFSQLERSKKQWVEDIDAISDYIAVHDQAWKIVRTNRSLATELGIPPAALVGDPISSLRHIAETGSALPCPFCRDTREAREEYIATSAGRTFL